MKNTYESFRENLLTTHDEPVLNYFGRHFYISYTEDEWYFCGDDGSNEQKFIDCEDLLDNAKIDGKLLSEIWDDIARSMGSDVKISLAFLGSGISGETITKKMELQPTTSPPLKIHTVWWYDAFLEEEYDDLSVCEKAYEFAKIMEGKEDIINEFKNNHGLKLHLFISGNHFNYDKYFSLPQNFITFIHKTNPMMIFQNNYDSIKRRVERN